MSTRIALLEPYYGGSHRQFADGLVRNSHHDIRIFSLPDRHWKWRMSHSAVQLYEQLTQSDFKPQVILANDLVDVAQLRGLMHRDGLNAPVVNYWHENQFAYPESENDQDREVGRDHHYRLQNYTSALASDLNLFNSEYNRSSFLEALPDFLDLFPDGQSEARIQSIREKCEVLPLGLELSSLDTVRVPPNEGLPLILWNHRWSYDKNPEAFFAALARLKEEDIAFELAVIGKGSERSPSAFQRAKAVLGDHCIHWGWVASREEYARWLWRSTVLPVTSRQDFFGISTVEAIYCGCIPILPARLAFPSHLRDSSIYYHDDKELYTMLKRTLTVASECKAAWREDVSRYDWTQLHTRYDDLLDYPLQHSPHEMD